MTLREMVNKYPNGLDWEIIVSNDYLLLKSNPIKETSFGISDGEMKIYLTY